MPPGIRGPGGALPPRLRHRLDRWAVPDAGFALGYHWHGQAPIAEHEYPGVGADARPLFASALRECLEEWLRRFGQERGNLFSDDDLFVLHYYVRLCELFPAFRREDLQRAILTLRQYGPLAAGFRPYDNEVIRKARMIREAMVPVEEESLFSYGGYAGLRPSGNLDHAESLLPTEIALIEQDAQRWEPREPAWTIAEDAQAWRALHDLRDQLTLEVIAGARFSR